jgi:pimeloyl-ACP methyl ester carboxylesterase
MDVRSAGEGERAVVLLHGFADGARTWRRVMPELARDHRVLAPRMPGLNGPDRPGGPGEPLLAGYVAALAELLAAEVAPVSLVGNSMGAALALAFALEHPGRVSRLVLVDMARVGSAQSLMHRLAAAPLTGRLVPLAAAVPPGLVARGFRTAHGRPLAAISRVPSRRRVVSLARVGHELSRALAESDLGERLGEITVPTLVVWGRRDPFVSLRWGRTLARAIPGARLAVLDRGGHRPQMDDPAGFLEVVAPFLRHG